MLLQCMVGAGDCSTHSHPSPTKVIVVFLGVHVPQGIRGRFFLAVRHVMHRFEDDVVKFLLELSQNCDRCDHFCCHLNRKCIGDQRSKFKLMGERKHCCVAFLLLAPVNQNHQSTLWLVSLSSPCHGWHGGLVSESSSASTFASSAPAFCKTPLGAPLPTSITVISISASN